MMKSSMHPKMTSRGNYQPTDIGFDFNPASYTTQTYVAVTLPLPETWR
jgi:hypothetical protein